MHWLILLIMALIFVILAKFLKPIDEVYTLAIYIAGILSAIWGLALSPTLAQLMIVMLVFGWFQVNFLRT